MSSLKDYEIIYLEKILNMSGGYVLSYTDATFEQFFTKYGIDIHSAKYCTYGTSKAKKMRSFWGQEPDGKVGEVLAAMLDSYEAGCEVGGDPIDKSLLQKCRATVARLSGKKMANIVETEAEFLDKEFTIPDLSSLSVETRVATIIEARLQEATQTLTAKAYLSTIFLCGSVLEGVLLGVAIQKPEQFNRSEVSPKDKNGKVLPFQKWTLTQFIDAAHDIGLLKLDVKKFSHGLRDFRNYIHIYEQMQSGFAPDEYTAKLCFQVLKAALADLTHRR